MEIYKIRIRTTRISDKKRIKKIFFIILFLGGVLKLDLIRYLLN
ncbi:Uncharacterized protein dnm_024790 [Desulfonema magnum]|uniref:Uncharacterized protein n=1 Tax=Desulfonema magnum TaxID=45655 RepID=A0A975GM23_9BACT|nr:Uncharacterized protein dnm_024790 [Desulfonema magnum]